MVKIAKILVHPNQKYKKKFVRISASITIIFALVLDIFAFFSFVFAFCL